MRDGEQLFWEMLKHLANCHRVLSAARRASGSATLQAENPRHRQYHDPLIARAWIGAASAAEGGGQVSLRLDLQSFLPRFAIIDTGARRDVNGLGGVRGIKAGEIGIFDKAYVDFGHLWDLDNATWPG